MEMVDMVITGFCFSASKSRSVNIFLASRSWIIFDVGFFDFEKMTSLDFFDMYLMMFDINSQYFVNIWSNLVNIWLKFININQI